MVNAEEVRQLTTSVIDECKRRLVGYDTYLKKILISLWANGHVLLEGNPGLAKTLAASTLAEVLGLKFNRIQFTPDLMPSDITGVNVFNQKTREFEFMEGPVFTNFLLCDEINRSPPKTQSALLEAMQERQVSVEGEARKLDSPFLVIATQNPLENAGVYPLPEAQQDRFLIKLLIDFPTREVERQMLLLKHKEFNPPVKTLTNKEKILEIQDYIPKVEISNEIIEYILNIVMNTRENRNLELGASPRASIALMQLGKATAAVNGRDFVEPDDVKFMAFDVLNHRLVLSHEAELDRVRIQDVVERILKES
ncbi:MAG: MoxR family ATPase, partial [Methanobacteriota archaeon]